MKVLWQKGGRDCGGGSCEAGVCGAVQVVKNQENCWDIKVDADYMYWRNGKGPNSVLRARKNGSDVEVLVAEVGGQGALDIDDAHIYWINEGTEAVRGIARSGESSTLLADVGESGVALVVDPTHVYFATRSGSVRSVPKSGGEVQILAQVPAPVILVLSADETHLYCTSRDESSAWKISKKGGDAEMISEGSASGGRAWGIVATDSNVIFFSHPQLIRVKKDGAQEIIFSNLDDSRFLLLDGSKGPPIVRLVQDVVDAPGWQGARRAHAGACNRRATQPVGMQRRRIGPVFRLEVPKLLLSGYGPGAILVAPIGAMPGDTPSYLAPGHSAHGIAYDEDYIYWTRWTATPETAGGVYKIRKPADY